MKEIPFSIPVTGIVRFDGDVVMITVNRTETSINLEAELRLGKRVSIDGRTLYDVILETAQEVVKRKGFNRFSAADLYSVGREKYPQLKRGSFVSRIVASTPNHGSYKHHSSRRDYFTHIGKGMYWLNEKYLPDKTFSENDAPVKE